MKFIRLTLLSIFSFQGSFIAVNADQPIMNMMPRWDNGYGIQFLTDHLHRADLKQGNSVIASGFSETITQIHMQGVYTWDRSIRATFKLPYITEARRERRDGTGGKRDERDQGLGDLTLALPLKKYFNHAARSSNWTFAPQVRVPMGSQKEGYQVAKRLWGSGLTFGYETEVYKWFFYTDFTTWIFEGDAPTELHATIDFGYTFQDNAMILWESDFKWDDADAVRLSAGPALYYRLQDQIHARLEWKHDFISRVASDTPSHGNGDRLSVGVGFVF